MSAAVALFLAIGSVAVAPAAGPVAIYVSPGGDDGASGTEAAPLATLAEARDRSRTARQAGDGPITVLLEDGTYSLGETLSQDARDSGTPDRPVQWKAAPGATPIVSGGRELHPEWSAENENIQVAEVGTDLDFDQLFVDGERQILARYPNYDPSKRLGGYAADAIAPDRIADWQNPTTALVRGLHTNEWGGNSYTVTGTNADGSLQLHWVGDNQRGSGLHATYRTVENVFEELDSPGEWFYDRATGKVYYWPADGIDPDAATFRTAELDELIRVQGTDAATPAHDITLSGITFTQTHRTLFNSTFEPVSLSDWAIVRKGAVGLKNTARITISGSTFDQVGGNGIFIDGYGSENIVTGNVFDGAGATDVAIVRSRQPGRHRPGATRSGP